MVINERVVVGMKDVPVWVSWRSRIYKITKIGLHHTQAQGDTLLHIFSVIADTVFMRIKLNTKSLIWTLEEVMESN